MEELGGGAVVCGGGVFAHTGESRRDSAHNGGFGRGGGQRGAGKDESPEAVEEESVEDFEDDVHGAIGDSPCRGGRKYSGGLFGWSVALYRLPGSRWRWTSLRLLNRGGVNGARSDDPWRARWCREVAVKVVNGMQEGKSERDGESGVMGVHLVFDFFPR